MPLSGDELLSVITLLQNLKTTKRTGWVRSGVKQPESISDHSHRCAMIGLILDGTPYGEGGALNGSHVSLLCTVHDVAESLIGDITPLDPRYISGEKQRIEESAVQDLGKRIGGRAGALFVSLWNEFEHGATPEADVARQIDKLEMIVQALEYEESDRTLDLSGFYPGAVKVITHPKLAEIARSVLNRRAKIVQKEGQQQQ